MRVFTSPALRARAASTNVQPTQSSTSQQQQQPQTSSQSSQVPSQWRATNNTASSRFEIKFASGSNAAAQPDATLSYRLVGQAGAQQQLELSSISVPEASREQGVATALVLALLAWAKEQRIQDIRLPDAEVRKFVEAHMSAWCGAGFTPMLCARGVEAPAAASAASTATAPAPAPVAAAIASS